MKQKLLVIGIVAAILFFIIIFLFIGGSAADKTVTREEYKTLVSGITAEIGEGETKDYGLDVLIDDEEFNSSIVANPYQKLTIQNIEDFHSLGFAFQIKAEGDCILKMTLYKNDEALTSQDLEVISNQKTSVALILDEAVEVKTTDNLYIVVEQLDLAEGQDRTNFVFDTLMTFFDEV